MSERKDVLSLKVKAAVRKTVEMLAARLTLESGRRHTLTDVVEKAIEDFAERERKRITE